MNIKPPPPSILALYNLSTSDLGWNAPCMMNNSLVFLCVASSSLFLQLTNAGAYLNMDTAQVLTPQTKFQSFSFDFKISP